MGAGNIAMAVATEEQAREAVRNLIDGGAVIIKVALEPGGEKGAPWLSDHHRGHENQPDTKLEGHRHKPSDLKQAWPLLPENIVKAIAACLLSLLQST